MATNWKSVHLKCDNDVKFSECSISCNGVLLQLAIVLIIIVVIKVIQVIINSSINQIPLVQTDCCSSILIRR